MGKFTLQSFRTIVVLAALTLTGYVSVAQVSAYTFAQTSGTFTVPTTNLLSTSGTSSTTPGSIFGTAYDDVSTTLTLPFTFNFNGTNYTTITVNTNGFLCFGSAASANTGYTSTNGNYLSGSTVTTNNGLAFFNVDMNERTQTTFSGARTSGSPTLTGVSAASISALTVGMRITGTGIPAGTIITAIGTNTVTMSANATSGTGTTTTVTPRTGVYASFSGASPNRVYSVTYVRTRRYNDATDNVSFQIQLEETTNIIRVVYGPATASATSNNVQVGIRSTTSDFNARKNDVTPNWSSTVAALANTDALTFSSSNFPTSGQTYTWTPYACMVSAPSALSTTTVLATSATITWTAPSPAPGNGYEIYHSTSSTAPTAGTTPTATVGAGVTTVTLNSSSTPAIAANNTYYVWVRSNCNGTDKSAWVALPSFNTLEGNNCGLVQDLALLTSPFSGTTVGYTNNFTTSNGSCLTGTGGDRIFKIDVPNNYSLFIGQSTNAYDSRHRIAYGGACPGTTEINTGYVANFPTTQTNGVVVGCLDDDDLTHYYFNNTTGSTQTVYWVQDGHLANQGTFALEWQLNAPPACLAPTALNASPITATSAQINWTAPSPAPGSGYEIYHSTSNTAPTAGTTATATVGAGVTTVTLNNLSTPAIAASTTYYVWVRSNCNGTDKSAWVALPSFTTPCASITAIPYSESFDAATDPACWSKALLTGSTNWAPDTDNDGVPAPRTGARFAGKTWSGNDDALWISPVFDFSSLSSTQTQLSVWIYRNTLDGLSTDRTTFYVNTTPNLSGTPLQLIDISLLGTVAPTVSTSGWYNYTANIPLSYNTGGNFYIIARGRTSSSLSSYGIGFDDFVVEAAPTCFPTPSAPLQEPPLQALP
ncbi:MAG: fibronectin type III domain-containing protein [Bacteroidetes bacterium]|nr:fibronectin type III domain-containing protein [Bacteroidota bacterium]